MQTGRPGHSQKNETSFTGFIQVGQGLSDHSGFSGVMRGLTVSRGSLYAWSPVYCATDLMITGGVVLAQVTLGS